MQNELYHHGVKGQKWGYRRWQNSDGSLTEEGRVHYSKGLAGFNKNRKARAIKKLDKKIDKTNKKLSKANSKYAPAYKKESAAEKRFREAESKVHKTEQRLDKAQNGLGAKLIGADKYRIKSLNKKLDSQNQDLIKAADKYNTVHAKAEQRRAKIVDIKQKLDNQTASQQKKINKYIKKYGNVEYSKIT